MSGPLLLFSLLKASKTHWNTVAAPTSPSATAAPSAATSVRSQAQDFFDSAKQVEGVYERNASAALIGERLPIKTNCFSTENRVSLDTLVEYCAQPFLGPSPPTFF